MAIPARKRLQYELVARNDQPNSPNPIHRDDYARSLGHPGGLVAGVTLYAYACDTAVRLMGGDWLQHGYGEVRFRKPVYDGEELTILAEPDDAGDWRVRLLCDGLRAEAVVGPYRESISDAGLECGGGGEPRGFQKDVSLKGELLRTPDERSMDREGLDRFITDSGLEGSPLARELCSRGLIAPSLITGAPFYLLWRSHPYAVVIHTSSATEWLGPARLGETLYTWGVVEDAFEKMGRFYVTQRVVTVDSAGNRVARMLHTGTYEPVP
jgi:acyl dehydratase